MSQTFRTRAEHGLEGAEAALLWEHGCSGIVQDEDGWIVAWFDERVELPLKGTWAAADDTDYLAQYYREVGPVTVGPLVVTPTHEAVTLRPGQKPLWLDPGMAFGSGHHETTHALLRQLSDLDLAGKSVLDVGAGSGILAMAADLLGADSVTGIDNDADTVPVATDNARLNHSRARFLQAALAEFKGQDPFAVDPVTGEPLVEWKVGTAPAFRAKEPFDIVIANLFAALHVQLMPAYCEQLAAGGLLLLSGIMTDQAAEVQAALTGAGMTAITPLEDGDWVSFTARKPAG